MLGSQSIGSSELIRNVASSVVPSRVRRSWINEVGGSKSWPYDPRCTPVRTTSLKPVATARFTSAATVGAVKLRPGPRVEGMMQYAQDSLHPV